MKASVSPSQTVMPAVAPETRIVAGVFCTWWGPAVEAARRRCTNGARLPVCPKCDGPLFVWPTEAAWWREVAELQVTLPFSGDYRAFLEWVKGRCYQDVDNAAELWRRSL